MCVVLIARDFLPNSLLCFNLKVLLCSRLFGKEMVSDYFFKFYILHLVSRLVFSAIQPYMRSQRAEMSGMWVEQNSKFFRCKPTNDNHFNISCRKLLVHRWWSTCHSSGSSANFLRFNIHIWKLRYHFLFFCLFGSAEEWLN